MKRWFSRTPVPFRVWKAQHSKTDAGFALEVGVHAMTINKWINGKVGLTYPWAKLLADIVGAPVTDLFEERTVPAPRTAAERRVDAALGSVLRGTPKADAKAAS